MNKTKLIDDLTKGDCTSIRDTLPLTSNWSLFKLNFSDPEQIKLK